MHQVTALSGVGLLLLAFSVKDLWAQTCQLAVAGRNQNRIVRGPLYQECTWYDPPGCLHSAPFGNWGVTSNYGHKQDGDQFQGWEPVWTWTNRLQWQWNTCTYDYPPPNPRYYNWNNNTQQRTVLGRNAHGTKLVAWWVSCPRDTNDDGICDTGGCKDLFAYGESNNWMTLYELDPFLPWAPWCHGDDLVETLYFPATEVYLTCQVGWCNEVSSAWQAPTSGWVTYAEMATVVSGVYQDGINCEYLRAGNREYNCYW